MSAQGLFSEAESRTIREIAARYEDPASAILPLLHFVQGERGFLGEEELVYVADLLKIPHVRAYEVATYYSMFTIRPRGRHLIQVCRNLSCTLEGSDSIFEYLKRELGVEKGGTSADGHFALIEVECIGACDQAPAIMIDEKLYGRVTTDSLRDILQTYRAES